MRPAMTAPSPAIASSSHGWRLRTVTDGARWFDATEEQVHRDARRRVHRPHRAPPQAAAEAAPTSQARRRRRWRGERRRVVRPSERQHRTFTVELYRSREIGRRCTPVAGLAWTPLEVRLDRRAPSRAASRSRAGSGAPWLGATLRPLRRCLTLLAGRCARLRSPARGLGERRPTLRCAPQPPAPPRGRVVAHVEGVHDRPDHVPPTAGASRRTARSGPAGSPASPLVWVVVCEARGRKSAGTPAPH